MPPTTLRIAIAQLWQETNTLNPLRTTRQDFEHFGVLHGAELVARMARTNELGGFIQSLRAWPRPPEIVGLVRLPAWPSGLVTDETFSWLREELVTSVRAAWPFDAMLLALHGAMAAESHRDVEGEMLAAIRDVTGSSLPIIATLDLHANVTREMVRHADVLVPYHTMPHVDIFETGQRAAAVLRRILDGAKPVSAFQKIPAVVPAENSSTEAVAGIAVDLKRRLLALEQHPDVLSCGVLPVQPWLDVPELGSSVLVTTNANPALALDFCAELSTEFWSRRSEYLPELLSIEDAVQRAHDLQHEGLVVLGDSADATTSGAPGDSVWILCALLQRDWLRPVLVTLVAPAVVEEATRLGVDAKLESELGGVRDMRFGTRVRVTATVERLFTAQFILSGHIGRELPIDMGSAAVLRVGQIRVIATSRSGPHFAPELFRSAGFDPFAASVVVAKSPCGFRAVYERQARAIYSVQARGCAPSDFWNYDYEQIQRPLWPWDKEVDWSPQPEVR